MHVDSSYDFQSKLELIRQIYNLQSKLELIRQVLKTTIFH